MRETGEFRESLRKWGATTKRRKMTLSFIDCPIFLFKTMWMEVS